MITAFIIAGSVLGYGIIAGAINGFLRVGLSESEWDDPLPVMGSIFWPLAVALWGPSVLAKYISNKTLAFFERRAAKNTNDALIVTQLRIHETKATRIRLKQSQEELREAHEELERELQENEGI